MRYSQEIIDQVTQANDIVEIISQYTQLKPKGRSYMGCCPFHSEKTPSFSVSREKQLYHCFGCGESGSLISFVMKAENMTFPEALQYLADRGGVTLPKQEMSKAEMAKEKLQQNIYEMNRLAANYYYKNLQRNPEALSYLKDRGLTDETIRDLGIGLAPEGWHVISTAMTKRGFREDDVVSSGLSLKNQNGGLYDRFRGRIIFPIQNSRGKVIGFGGRKWKEDDQGPKYLNSPESPVFHKGYELYNLNRARKNISSDGYLIFVEGYMDVAGLYNHGIKNAVAALGTSFTPEHAAIIDRIASEIVICFDGDEAGEKATLRTLDIFKKSKAKKRILRLPPEHDPDSFIKAEGTEAFEEAVRNAVSPVEFRLMNARRGLDMTSYNGKVDYYNRALEILSSEDPAEQDYIVSRIAEETGFDRIMLRRNLQKQERLVHRREETPAERKPVQKKLSVPRPYRQAEIVVMTVFLQDAQRLKASGLKKEDFEPGFFQWLYEKIEKIQEEGPVLLNTLFASEEDMIYNKRTSVLVGNSIDKAESLYPQSLQAIRRYTFDQKIKDLKKRQEETADTEEKERLGCQISQMLKDRQ